MATTLLEAALIHAVPDEVAREINDEHHAAGLAMRDGLAHARRAGELLLSLCQPRVPPPRRTRDRLQGDAHGVAEGVQEGEVPGHVAP